jgi:predicted nucleotide-binding protein
LKDRLHLQYVEFNTESAAGVGTQERLSELLDQASFAFLVMTAEDEQSDGSKRARENVVHEAGLFQGRLTFRRAIVVAEEGTAEFSNIHGLGQIRFPNGRIQSCFEEVRKVVGAREDREAA